MIPGSANPLGTFKRQILTGKRDNYSKEGPLLRAWGMVHIGVRAELGTEALCAFGRSSDNGPKIIIRFSVS